jgi:hypothetical protein
MVRLPVVAENYLDGDQPSGGQSFAPPDGGGGSGLPSPKNPIGPVQGYPEDGILTFRTHEGPSMRASIGTVMFPSPATTMNLPGSSWRKAPAPRRTWRPWVGRWQTGSATASSGKAWTKWQTRRARSSRFRTTVICGSNPPIRKALPGRTPRRGNSHRQLPRVFSAVQFPIRLAGRLYFSHRTTTIPWIQERRLRDGIPTRLNREISCPPGLILLPPIEHQAIAIIFC